MRGRCVYIVLGRPHLDRCSIEGGVLISGSGTAPLIRRRIVLMLTVLVIMSVLVILMILLSTILIY